MLLGYCSILFGVLRALESASHLSKSFKFWRKCPQIPWENFSNDSNSFEAFTLNSFSNFLKKNFEGSSNFSKSSKNFLGKLLKSTSNSRKFFSKLPETSRKLLKFNESSLNFLNAALTACEFHERFGSFPNLSEAARTLRKFLKRFAWSSWVRKFSKLLENFTNFLKIRRSLLKVPQTSRKGL